MQRQIKSDCLWTICTESCDCWTRSFSCFTALNEAFTPFHRIALPSLNCSWVWEFLLYEHLVLGQTESCHGNSPPFTWISPFSVFHMNPASRLCGLTRGRSGESETKFTCVESVLPTTITVYRLFTRVRVTPTLWCGGTSCCHFCF